MTKSENYISIFFKIGPPLMIEVGSLSKLQTSFNGRFELRNFQH